MFGSDFHSYQIISDKLLLKLCHKYQVCSLPFELCVLLVELIYILASVKKDRAFFRNNFIC